MIIKVRLWGKDVAAVSWNFDREFATVEFYQAYHKMALSCGISMTECRLLSEGKIAHFMTKRFDRTDKGEKLHTQTSAIILRLKTYC